MALPRVRGHLGGADSLNRGLIAYWRHKTWASFVLKLLGVALSAILWMLWTSVCSVV